jgi:membrane protease YdiL (CAAX protease family)
LKNQSLTAYFVILVFLCASFVIGAKMLGEKGAYLAQGYMMTPAIAALITRLFFCKPHFQNANLRFGKLRDYIKYWLFGLGITAFSYAIYTLLGAISWDFTGIVFLDRLTQQFAKTGQNINDTLPPGFTPTMMLALFSVGGLTVFNVFPGIITGFGEEFGHRGFMFPALYLIKPWIGFGIGGLIVFAWHLPLMLMVPDSTTMPIWLGLLNIAVLAVGTIFAHIYLAYVYVNSESIFVASFAHITMNNAAAAFSYFVIIRNQALANLGLTLTMLVVVVIMVSKKMFVSGEFSNVKSTVNAEIDMRQA